MGRKPDYVRKKFGSQKAKTLHHALAHRIATDFPRIGGRRLCNVCVDMILEEMNRHMQPLERVHHGQVVWTAVNIDDPPRRHQSIADTDLVPVVLNLSTSEDIDARVGVIVQSCGSAELPARFPPPPFNRKGVDNADQEDRDPRTNP